MDRQAWLANARAANQRSADSYSGSLQPLSGPRETCNSPTGPAPVLPGGRVLSPSWEPLGSDESIAESPRKRAVESSDRSMSKSECERSVASLRNSRQSDLSSLDEIQRSQGVSYCGENGPKMDGASSGMNAEGARETVFRAWLDSLLISFEYYLAEVNGVAQPGAYRHLLHEQRLRMHKLAKELMAAADSKDAALSKNFSAVGVATLELQPRMNPEPALQQTTALLNPAPEKAPGRRLSIFEQARSFGQKMNRMPMQRMIEPPQRHQSWDLQCDVQQLPPCSHPTSLTALEPTLSGISDMSEEVIQTEVVEQTDAWEARFSPILSGGSRHSRSKHSWVSGKERLSQPRQQSARLDRQATAIIENTVGHEEDKSVSKLPRMSLSSMGRVKEEVSSSIKLFVTSRSSMRKAISEIYSVAIMYSLVFTPVVVCLLNPPSPAVSVLEVFCEVVFVANVTAIFAYGTEDKETNKWVASFSKVIQNTPWLLTQLLVAVPWHLIWLLAPGHQDVLLKLSMLRLLQLPRFVSESVFGSSEAHLWSKSTWASVHPNLLRVVRLIALFFLMVHLIACGYYSVAVSQQGEWAMYAVGQAANSPSKWMHAFYWALCGVLGENMNPVSDAEVSYNSACTAMGVMLNSCIVGSITSLLGNVDKRAAKQKAKIDTINAFMHKNGVTPDLCEQVRQYYKYLYASSSNAELLFEELSESLRLKIDLCIHKKFIKQCHIFASCSPECIATLVTIISRNSSIFVPREVVFRKGDIGDAMFFVVKGEVMLYSPGNIKDDNLINLEELRSKPTKDQGGAKSLAMAHAGDFFGEKALLVHDNVRSASAASMTFAELLCLPRLDFESVLMWYPQFSASLKETVWSQPSIESQPFTKPPPPEYHITPDETSNTEEFSPESSWASKVLRPDPKEPLKNGGVSEVCESNGAYASPMSIPNSASLLPVN